MCVYLRECLFCSLTINKTSLKYFINHIINAQRRCICKYFMSYPSFLLLYLLIYFITLFTSFAAIVLMIKLLNNLFTSRF